MDRLLQVLSMVFTEYRASAPKRQGKMTQGNLGVPDLVTRTGSAALSAQHPVAEAIHHVVVHHPHGLHESVADGGSDEVEAALLKFLADRI
jgi:hypothetical protein